MSRGEKVKILGHGSTEKHKVVSFFKEKYSSAFSLETIPSSVLGMTDFNQEFIAFAQSSNSKKITWETAADLFWTSVYSLPHKIVIVTSDIPGNPAKDTGTTGRKKQKKKLQNDLISAHEVGFGGPGYIRVEDDLPPFNLAVAFAWMDGDLFRRIVDYYVTKIEYYVDKFGDKTYVIFDGIAFADGTRKDPVLFYKRQGDSTPRVVPLPQFSGDRREGDASITFWAFCSLETTFSVKSTDTDATTQLLLLLATVLYSVWGPHTMPFEDGYPMTYVYLNGTYRGDFLTHEENDNEYEIELLRSFGIRNPLTQFYKSEDWINAIMKISVNAQVMAPLCVYKVGTSAFDKGKITSTNIWSLYMQIGAISGQTKEYQQVVTYLFALWMFRGADYFTGMAYMTPEVVEGALRRLNYLCLFRVDKKTHAFIPDPEPMVRFVLSAYAEINRIDIAIDTYNIYTSATDLINTMNVSIKGVTKQVPPFDVILNRIKRLSFSVSFFQTTHLEMCMVPNPFKYGYVYIEGTDTLHGQEYVEHLLDKIGRLKKQKSGDQVIEVANVLDYVPEGGDIKGRLALLYGE